MKQHYQFILLTIYIGLLLVFSTTASAQIPNPGDWVDDLTQDIQFMVDELWYNLLLLVAQIQAISMSFTIAMLVLGLSYMIAHFIHFNVVEFKSAFTWYVLVALFFQLGPELYLGMNGLRHNINSFFYATSLHIVSNSESPLAPLSNNLSDDGIPMLPPCDNFGWMTGNTTIDLGQGVDGLDIAMAYLRAITRDVLSNPLPVIGNCITVNPGGYPPNLPFRWYFTDGYFDQEEQMPFATFQMLGYRFNLNL